MNRTISRRYFLKYTGSFLLGGLVAACSGGQSETQENSLRSESEQQPLVTETLEQAYPSLEALPSEVIKSPTPEPVVCTDTLQALQEQEDVTRILGNPLTVTGWKPEEKDTIVDASGNAIYPDVKAIAQKGEEVKLIPDMVAISAQGGMDYSLIFTDNEGNVVWPRVIDLNGGFVPGPKPDANGNITADEWDVISEPEWGKISPWVQMVHDKSCVYIVAKQNEKLVGVYRPDTKKWEMDEELRPSAADIARSLGFSEGREYKIQEKRLIDVQSGLGMGVKEESVWRVADDEERYGALVNLLDQPMVIEEKFGDMYHRGDERYRRVSIDAVFTGYIEAVKWIFPETGKEITDYRGLVVFRDEDGSIKKFWVSMFSPDTSEAGLVGFRYRWGGSGPLVGSGYKWGGNGSLEAVSVEEAYKRYQAGQIWNLDIVYMKPGGGFQKPLCYEHGLCTSEYNKKLYLLDENKDGVSQFGLSLLDENIGTSVKDDLLVAPDTLHVYTATDPFLE